MKELEKRLAKIEAPMLEESEADQAREIVAYIEGKGPRPEEWKLSSRVRRFLGIAERITNREARA